MLGLGSQWAATWEALSWGLNDHTEITLACCRKQPVVFKDGNRTIAGVGSDVVWVRCGAPGHAPGRMRDGLQRVWELGRRSC